MTSNCEKHGEYFYPAVQAFVNELGQSTGDLDFVYAFKPTDSKSTDHKFSVLQYNAFTDAKVPVIWNPIDLTGVLDGNKLVMRDAADMTAIPFKVEISLVSGSVTTFNEPENVIEGAAVKEAQLVVNGVRRDGATVKCTDGVYAIFGDQCGQEITISAEELTDRSQVTLKFAVVPDKDKMERNPDSTYTYMFNGTATLTAQGESDQFNATPVNFTFDFANVDPYIRLNSIKELKELELEWWGNECFPANCLMVNPIHVTHRVNDHVFAQDASDVKDAIYLDVKELNTAVGHEVNNLVIRKAADVNGYDTYECAQTPADMLLNQSAVSENGIGAETLTATHMTKNDDGASVIKEEHHYKLVKLEGFTFVNKKEDNSSQGSEDTDLSEPTPAIVMNTTLNYFYEGGNRAEGTDSEGKTVTVNVAASSDLMGTNLPAGNVDMTGVVLPHGNVQLRSAEDLKVTTPQIVLSTSHLYLIGEKENDLVSEDVIVTAYNFSITKANVQVTPEESNGIKYEGAQDNANGTVTLVFSGTVGTEGKVGNFEVTATNGTDTYNEPLMVSLGTDTQTSVEGIAVEGHVRVYNMQGMLLIDTDDASRIKTLAPGLYIVNGKKMILN